MPVLNASALAEGDEEATANLDSVWILLNTMNIFNMQIGFALLEAGTVAKKHQKSILMKNLMDGCFSAIGWFFTGFGIYSGSGLFESSEFLTNNIQTFPDFLVSYAFAVTTTTIVSGGVAARMKIKVYLAMSFVLTGFFYPIVAHWVWGGGWLTGEYLDFAGGVVVHGVGGTIALVGAYFAGPRVGRFTQEPNRVHSSGLRTINGVNEIPVASSSLQVLGGLMLWVAWFSFNGVSGGGASSEELALSIRACMNSLLSSAFSACIGMLYTLRKEGYYGLSQTLNCLLAGLVAITPCCAYVDTWAACSIGVLSSLVFLSTEAMTLFTLRVDDPLSAFPLHGACGVFGGICTGIFHRSHGLIRGETALLFRQLWGTVLIIGMTFTFATLFFGALKFYLGSLSCSEDDQILGLDFKYHDGKRLDNLTEQEVMEFNATKSALNRAKAKKKQDVIERMMHSSAKSSSVAPSQGSTSNR